MPDWHLTMCILPRLLHCRIKTAPASLRKTYLLVTQPRKHPYTGAAQPTTHPPYAATELASDTRQLCPEITVKSKPAYCLPAPIRGCTRNGR
jgi:hypothetical protein